MSRHTGKLITKIHPEDSTLGNGRVRFDQYNGSYEISRDIEIPGYLIELGNH